MARLRTSGFELNSTTSGIEFDGIQGTVTIASSPVRSGNYSLRTQGGAVNSIEMKLAGSEISDTTIYARIYIRIASAPSARRGVLFFGNVSGTQRCAIALETDRTLKLFDSSVQIGSASSVLSTNTWYLIEMSYNNNTSSGNAELEARLEESSFASTTTSTNTGGILYCRAGWQGGGGDTVDLYHDDLAINDDTGSKQNSWPGQGSVLMLNPASDGDSNTWLKSGGGAGTTTNYQDVDEVTPDDGTSYLKSSTSNNDSYDVDFVSMGSDSIINVVEVHTRYSGEGGAGTNFKVGMKKEPSGTEDFSSLFAPGGGTYRTNTFSTPRVANFTRYVDPDSNPWTANNIQNSQVIMEASSSAGSNATLVTKLWVLIDYVDVASSNKNIMNIF